MRPTMGRRSVVVDFIFIVSYGLLCYAEQWDLGPLSSDQGLSEDDIYRRSRPVQGPAQSLQSATDFASNTFQNPVASWRPAPAMVAAPSQEFVQIPMQVQSQRAGFDSMQFYNPMQSQVNFGPRKPEQVPPRVPQKPQGFEKPIQGPDLHPVIKDEVVMQSEFKLKVPVPANSVEVQCGEMSVKVLVQQDFLGNNQFINPSDLTLGGCSSVRYDDHAGVVGFESELQGCGSTLAMTEDSLVYSFVLVYSPSPVPNTPIVKTNEAMVEIHCIYPRKHNVSSNALSPTWIPYAAVKAGEEPLQFSLKLMTDDWRYERPSNTYFLGNVINIEVSVIRAQHVPLRVFVESCVATMGPSGNAATVYTFIENNGCMMDAKLTGSRSKFMPRIQDNKLQFQLEAFRFKQDKSGLLYISCHLRATTTSAPIDAMHKACSFIAATRSWVGVDGDDQVCGCCESSCGMRKGRSLDEDPTMEDEATIGPIFVQERPPSENKPLLQIQESSQISSKDAEISIELVLLTGLVAAVGILCIVILGTLFYQRRRKRLALICD